MTKKYNKLSYVLNLLICILMVAAASLRRDGKLLGHEVGTSNVQNVDSTTSTVRHLANGTTVINTSTLGKGITGFGGTVPLEIYLNQGVVKQVKALPNHESPEFFGRAKTLLTRWNGKTVKDALEAKVDGVSGATYSSKAILGNMKAGLEFASKTKVSQSAFSAFDVNAKNLVGLIVALMAAIVPLFVKNRRYRIFQQILNIVVLGFWCGTFMSWSSLTGYMSNGMNVVALTLPCIILIVAFIYPLFGKKKYYCTNICPYGSIQELVGKSVNYKLHLSNTTLKRLNNFRQILFAGLMMCLWTGLWSDWVDYEPFSAFIFQSASWVVIVIAVFFAALSAIVMRPYCRFVCPMGTLLGII